MQRLRAHRELRRAAQAFCSCLLLCALAVAAAEERYSWPRVERVIAFGDVHGAYDELTRVLRSAGVTDADLRWKAGAAHVVSLGDLLDRGAGSRKAMDLLMRLQGEAAAAGGALHVVLGNHEAMNLLGDLRDTTPAELAAYAAEEPAGIRERMRAEWSARQAKEPAARFDELFPPGYFGQRAALAPDGKYGRWLLSLPVAIVIGETLFMHGGPSKVLAGLSLDQINRQYHAALSDYLRSLSELTAANLVRAEDPFAERAELAEKRLAVAPAQSSDAQRARADAVRRFAVADRHPLLEPDGPNWYRGTALCNEVSESDILRPLLQGLGVQRLVVGHTVTRNRRVASRFDGRVIKLDTGMNRAVYQGHPAALLLEGGAARVAYADEAGPPGAVFPEPLYVSSPIDDELVVSTLARGTVTVTGTRAPGSFDVTVESGEHRVPALFTEARDDAVRKELAAFRLDRALRLGLVPATVERELQGRRGILQARPVRWFSQAEVESKSMSADGWCALPPQFELMYAFDAVIGNDGRTRESIVYDAATWMLLLTGHARAFGAGRELPAHLQSHPPAPGPEMRRRLASLDAASLARAVGDVLSKRDRDALLARRDALLGGKASRTAAP
ncbi:MAG TPA: metallophosphoesterase [Myxococcales bacterium]|nr:metallophosphoesterase [Myxococcales bacterium]